MASITSRLFNSRTRGGNWASPAKAGLQSQAARAIAAEPNGQARASEPPDGRATLRPASGCRSDGEPCWRAAQGRKACRIFRHCCDGWRGARPLARPVSALSAAFVQKTRQRVSGNPDMPHISSIVRMYACLENPTADLSGHADSRPANPTSAWAREPASHNIAILLTLDADQVTKNLARIVRRVNAVGLPWLE